MTRIYRAWSPSRGRARSFVTCERDEAAGVVGTLNQLCHVDGNVADWQIQYSEPGWRDEP